jgi:diacylglycerol kinase (ATP)
VATLAILNPVAGRHSAMRIWRRIRAEVPDSRDWECVVTACRGHAVRVAREARGYNRVVAIGGDGTACEVANGLADSDTPMAIVPAGTGNDLARNLGVPHDPLAAARLAARAVPRHIDLGQLRTSQGVTCFFLNVAGFGFDAEVAWRVNRRPHGSNGTLPYIVGALQALRTYASPVVRLTIDGQPAERQIFLVAVGNCASYAGGMRIVPQARPDDGAFDVCVVSNLRRLEVLRVIPWLYSGRHVSHPAVELFRCRTLQAETLSAASDGASARVLCHADGESVGGLPVHFAIRPGALWCVTGRAPG